MIDEADIEKLAEKELNGWQVRVCTFWGQFVHAKTPSQMENAVKLAHQWALTEKDPN